MIDLNKVNSSFDLKNVDADQITRTLSQHQNSLIKLALVIGTLVIAGLMFNDYRVKVQGVSTMMAQIQAKLDVIKGREAAIQDLDHFKSTLHEKINEFQLITLISDYAKLYHITITSLSPAESKDMGLYDAININFNAVSDGFKNMMFFLREIEKSDFSLRVNSWAGHEVDNGKITFDIEISAVRIHI